MRWCGGSVGGTTGRPKGLREGGWAIAWEAKQREDPDAGALTVAWACIDMAADAELRDSLMVAR